MFPSISPKQSFPALESEILAYWKANNTFQKSVDSRPEDNPYRFYDGPPFITGTPHYGSLLSSIVKDVVGRYWTMRGRRVDRVWGWDCHGLPIEEKVQKKLGLKSNKEIEERGVKEFIDGCYEYTQSTSAEWDWYIDKIGRWVDMDRAYRTMDQDYMESVMWVFSELWKKGLIYEGKRVSLYSWKLSTPISNFEVAMDDTYQEVNDPAITVKFALEQDGKSIDTKEGGSFEYTEDGYLRYVLAVITNEKGEYLMLKNIKHGEKWQCPGGKIDAGETAEVALSREVMEELGVNCIIGKKLTEKKIIASGTLWQGEYYEVTLNGTPKIQEPHKHAKLEWVSLTKTEDGYILQSETEKREDLNFIRENFDLWNLATLRPNIEKISILAWTTTPWTIPANMALAVRNDIDYLLVENNGEGYIVAKNRVENVFKGKGECTIIREFKGSELVGLSYVPPFPEYYHNKNGEKNHKVYHADFITDTDGTGIGHEAPEFGDVDFQLAKKEGIYISEAMDEAGKYTSQIFDYEGTHYLNLEEPEKGANKINIERMKANGTLFKLEGITHRVPFCPRSGTPLMQKAQSSWFIDIQSQKEKLLKANEQINWFPEHLKFGRFAKGIESAPDWCISRTRFWGAPMPVWMGEDGEKVVVSSRDEIFEMNKPYRQLTKLIITRHAESVANVERHYDDVGLSPLSPTGREQAESLMQELKDTGVDIIITSPFVRAIETAEPLAKELGIEIITDNRLKETDHGKFANANYNDENTRKLVHEQRDRIFADKSVKFGETGESYTDVEIRMRAVIEEICEKYPGKTVFVVSHGFPVRIATEYLTGKGAADRTNNAETRTFILDVANKNLLNLHKPYIDAIKLQSPETGNTLTRIPEVLDVWMDSGSMPYAQMHYPFENKGAMEASFPADFIAEYVGQVRAWFYVMHVLGVLLNPNKESTPTPSFMNVITTGVINGNDGRKMSKSFQNYPDPRMAIEKYGADPIRFYMLNSPLLSGGDMDFKEEGIVETIKGVMLPIWNTYSFFTTYANIDKWEKDSTDIWIVRHGETTTNASKAVNGGSMDTPLTEKGQMQSSERGKSFREHGIGFDVIITTPKMRTKQTAEHIAKEIGFTGVWDEFDEFTEQDMGEFEGRNHDELREEWIQKHGNDIGWTRIYRENTKESFENFIVRVENGMKKLREKYSGKRVLIVAHGGTARAIGNISLGYTYEEAIISFPPLRNGEAMNINNTPILNPLDRWIISKLQVLIGQVHDAMDGYDVSRACRAIVDYMDELTNWYVRLSRRRFWGSEMTGDKASGYETLYTVLAEVSKLLAPYMPFLAESIYKGLTGRESVHLEYITEPSRHLIASELNRDMEICEHIVSLGLALRSRKNIRVRQPLSSVTITRELDNYYQTIIRDELNIKEVRFENPEKLAKKICKPDARKIGPKYGKDVQKVIMEAKNGNFIEKENGIIDVGGFVLEVGEYVMEYLPLEGTLDVEGGYGMVVGLDTTITEELKLEGYARDIIRLIQDMRKEGDYQVTDRIEFSLTGPGTEKILELFGTYICHETLSVIKVKLSNPEVSKTEEIDNGITISLEVRRVQSPK